MTEGWRGAVGVMGRPSHDPRSRERFLADLEAETDRSLARDPERWPWQRTTDTADGRKAGRRAREAS